MIPRFLPVASAHEEVAAMAAALPGAHFHPATVDILAVERQREAGVIVVQVPAVVGGDVHHDRRQRRPVDPSKLLLSMAEAGRQLGIDPKARLKDLIAEGSIASVPSPTGPRIPRGEVLRLVQEGIPKPGAGRTRRKRRSTEPLPPADQVAAEIMAIKVD